MFVKIEKLLNEEQLQLVDQLIQTHEFEDGVKTTGAPTKAIKHNLQLDLLNSPQRDEFMKMMARAINSHKVLQSVAIPRRFTPPIISKYEPGMSYGLHIDNPIMHTAAGPVRTDLACTLFVSRPEEYEGGELLSHGPSGEIRVRLKRGDAVLYPASTRHRVGEVTRGARLAVVFWLQSMVADFNKREIMHQLDVAYSRVLKDTPQSEAVQLIQQVQANLARMWAEV